MANAGIPKDTMTLSTRARVSSEQREGKRRRQRRAEPTKRTEQAQRLLHQWLHFHLPLIETETYAHTVTALEIEKKKYATVSTPKKKASLTKSSGTKP